MRFFLTLCLLLSTSSALAEGGCWKQLLAWIPWGHPAFVPLQYAVRVSVGRTAPPTLSHSFRSGECYFAVREMGLALLRFPGVRLDDIHVLFITHATGWTNHAVLQYRGYVYDPESKVAIPVPNLSYFTALAEKAYPPYLPKSEVRTIPFSLFRNFGRGYGPGHFVDGMKDSGISTEPDAFPSERFLTQTLSDYANSLSR